jgi:hypothetical protein
VTNILEAAGRYGAREVALPGWEQGCEFACKLRRPGLVNMAEAAGFVPNPLLNAIEELFFPAGGQTKLPPDQQARALYEIARYALTEPTMEELNRVGLTLTDEQYLAIYAFALKGVEGLARFRESVRSEPLDDGGSVLPAAVEAGRA